MDVSTLVNHDGHLKMHVGGRNSWKVKTIRGYNVSLEWVNDPSRRKPEAAMVIWHDTGLEGRGFWAITRRAVALFTDHHNKPTPYCFHEALQALPLLEREMTKVEVNRLVDVVMDSIGDLAMMPSTPPAVRQRVMGQAMFDVTRKDMGGRVVSEGQA